MRVVEASFSQHRQTHLPIETRGCLAIWDGGREHLTFHIGNQVPHPLRTQLAARLRLSESQVTVISPDVGGGFGQKIALYREELTVAALARELRAAGALARRPHGESAGRESCPRADLPHPRGRRSRGARCVALDLEIVEDFGAYCFYPANYLARVVAMILTGPYAIDTLRLSTSRSRSPTSVGAGPMRAPMSITSWVMEGTIDAIARKLGRDPVDVRRVNTLHQPGSALHHGDRRGARGHHPARRRWKGRSLRSTTARFASARRPRARMAAISALVFARWWNRPPTARASTRWPASPAPATRRCGCASSLPAWSTRRSA